MRARPAFRPRGLRGRLHGLPCQLLAALAAMACAAALCLGPAPALAAGARAASSSQADVTVSSSADDAASSAVERVYDPDLGEALGFLPSEVDMRDARSTTISRLASADLALDGQLVTFVGEVLGEPVRIASGMMWVQMQSSSGSAYIMVVMTPEQVSLIENYGAYQVKGTTLRVTGVYRVADEANLGDIDVNAYAVEVVDTGGVQVEPVTRNRLWVGLACVALGAVVLGLGAFLKRRSS